MKSTTNSRVKIKEAEAGKPLSSDGSKSQQNIIPEQDRRYKSMYAAVKKISNPVDFEELKDFYGISNNDL